MAPLDQGMIAVLCMPGSFLCACFHVLRPEVWIVRARSIEHAVVIKRVLSAKVNDSSDAVAID